MLETAEELAVMQQLLESSAAGAGGHLSGIITDERRPSVAEICEEMTGMCLVTVATVTTDGRPVAGPLDGYLLHGELWASSSPDSVRIGHLRRRPGVSVTYLPSERFALTVHGTAELAAFQSDDATELRQAMLDHYVPIQGDSFAKWVETIEAVAVRIRADKMFAFRMSD